MAVEVENEGVGGVKGGDGSFSGRLPSVAGQFFEEVEVPNTGGDIEKNWRTEMGNEEGGVR